MDQRYRFLSFHFNEKSPITSRDFLIIIHLIFPHLGEMIVSSSKYLVQEHSKSLYETKMSVTVKKFEKEDVGSYRCIAKNSLGEVDSSIRLYGECFLPWQLKKYNLLHYIYKVNFFPAKFFFCILKREFWREKSYFAKNNHSI